MVASTRLPAAGHASAGSPQHPPAPQSSSAPFLFILFDFFPLFLQEHSRSPPDDARSRRERSSTTPGKVARGQERNQDTVLRDLGLSSPLSKGMGGSWDTGPSTGAAP